MCRRRSKPDSPKRCRSIRGSASALPSGTPEVAAKTLTPILLEIAQRDEFREFLKNFAGEPFPGDAAEFEKTHDQSNKDWEFFVTLAKIDAQ